MKYCCECGKPLKEVIKEGKTKSGTFKENDETSSIVFYSISNLPSEKDLRGNLTKMLYDDVLASLLKQ